MFRVGGEHVIGRGLWTNAYLGGGGMGFIHFSKRKELKIKRRENLKYVTFRPLMHRFEMHQLIIKSILMEI